MEELWNKNMEDGLKFCIDKCYGQSNDGMV